MPEMSGRIVAAVTRRLREATTDPDRAGRRRMRRAEQQAAAEIVRARRRQTFRG